MEAALSCSCALCRPLLSLSTQNWSINRSLKPQAIHAKGQVLQARPLWRCDSFDILQLVLPLCELVRARRCCPLSGRWQVQYFHVFDVFWMWHQQTESSVDPAAYHCVPCNAHDLTTSLRAPPHTCS
jgi:hypothetical protein